MIIKGLLPFQEKNKCVLISSLFYCIKAIDLQADLCLEIF